MYRVLSLTILSFTAFSLSAQDVVDTQLSAIDQQMRGIGYSLAESYRTLWLRDDATEELSIRLDQAYKYQIWGVCDGDCEDLDFELLDAYGNQVDIDNQTDDVPVVDPENPRTGPYILKVKMYECTIEPCKVGVAIYRNSGGGGGNNQQQGLFGNNNNNSGGSNTPTQNVHMEQVNMELRDIESGLGGSSRFRETEYVWLNKDEEQTIQVQLSNLYEYQIWGACDNDCEDLDMELLDQYGNQIDQDILTDSRPLINPSRPASGLYTLKVKMYNCTVEPCAVGVVFYRNSGGGNNQQQGLFGNNNNNSGGSNTPTQNVHMEQVNMELRDIESGLGGYSRFRETEYVWLNKDEEQTIQVQLSSFYEYQIWGACDNDCEDLDMELLDQYGNQIDQDVLTDSRPLINPSRPASGLYTLKVKMYNCTIEPCAVGVVFYNR